MQGQRHGKLAGRRDVLIEHIDGGGIELLRRCIERRLGHLVMFIKHGSVHLLYSTRVVLFLIAGMARALIFLMDESVLALGRRKIFRIHHCE